MRQLPSADMAAGAWILEIAFVDAVLCERAQVRAIDLHQADVVQPGAWQVRAIDGLRIQAGRDAGDWIEQIGRHAIALRGICPA